MAKNITLMGASYTDVPAVILPQTGGGTARFDDASVTTATAEDVAEGKVFLAADGTEQTGTAVMGGGASEFTITLTKNASTGVWEPDCTYAQAVAAYTGGDYVTYFADGGTVEASYDEFTGIYYTVYEYFAEGFNNLGYHVPSYLWTAGGVTEQYSETAYITSQANATPADVASGKKFFNADGYQVGTASGGSDEDYIAMIERTTAVTSLPEGVTTIGDYAFRECTSLALTSLPSGITSIGVSAFEGCTNLALTALPDNITTIKGSSFRYCPGLALTSLPSRVTIIESYAFENCTSLALTSLPSGLTKIGIYAFSGCTNLELTTLPDSVYSIDNYAFKGCDKITTISCNGAITTLGAYSLNGNGSSHPSQLLSASFPNMTVSSLSYAFGYTSYINACRVLETVDIGSTKAIAASAFANCYKLQTLVLRKSNAICTLANVSAFLNTPMRGYNSLSGTIYVPSALISTYQTATNWSTIYGEGHVTFAAIEGSEYEL